MSNSIIKVKDLVKKYDNLTAVDKISFEVLNGEIFALVGPNGAGKTTTVEILECLRTPTSGTARIFGYEITENESRIKERIGVVPQEFNTFERLTVEENVKLIARIYGKSRNTKETLQELQLREFKNTNFGELSGGMKRRVGIAMALISEPDLLFLDEPTTGLDPQARKRLWTTIEGFKEIGVTVVLTTHYMEEVEALSDRASIMMNGRLLSTNSVDNLISKYGGNLKIVVKNEKSKAQEILKGFTEDISYGEKGTVIGSFLSKERAAEAHLELYRKLPNSAKVTMDEPSMDDVFLHVAGGRIDNSGELIR